MALKKTLANSGGNRKTVSVLALCCEVTVSVHCVCDGSQVGKEPIFSAAVPNRTELFRDSLPGSLTGKYGDRWQVEAGVPGKEVPETGCADNPSEALGNG